MRGGGDYRRLIRNLRLAKEREDAMQEIERAEEFDAAEIVPIPAKCRRCGRDWTGTDAIRAPSLHGCRCADCQGRLGPHPDFPNVADAASRRADRLAAAGLAPPDDERVSPPWMREYLRQLARQARRNAGLPTDDGPDGRPQ